MEMDIIKELNLLIQMHYSCDIDSRDEWLREIIYLKSRFESKVNNVVLDDVSNCGGIIIPKKLTDKNKTLSRAMIYISEDADEGCNIAKQIFIELGSLIEE